MAKNKAKGGAGEKDDKILDLLAKEFFEVEDVG